MLGYHPCGQRTGAWFRDRTWEGTLRGFEQPARSALRNYISRKYGSVSALRTAWGDPDIAVEKVDAPTIRNRKRSLAGAFRDPIIERRGIGFLEFSKRRWPATA